MARIPLQVAQRGLDTPPMVQYPQGGGPVGAALEGLGNSVSAVAMQVKRRQDQQADFDAKVAEMEFSAKLSGLEQDAETNAAADGTGIHDSVYGQLDPESHRAVKPGSFDQLFDSYLERMPEARRAEFAAKREVYRLDGSNRLAGAEYKARQKYETFQIQKAQTDITNAMAAGDPNDIDTFEKFRKQGLDLIESSGLPALEKEVARVNWLANADETLFKTRLEKDPEFAGKARAALGLAPTTPAARGSGSVIDRIIGVESGGKANAKNPNSSATGAGQFIGSTWLSMVERHRPDLLRGRTRDEVLALRNDYALSREMVGHLADDNAAALRAAGVQVNDGALYLAHFAGSAGAIRILRAAPDASARSVLGDAVVDANPFLQNKTASQVAAWAANKMDSAVPAATPADPQYANIPLDRRLVLANQADVLLGQRQRAAASEQAAEYTAYKDAMELSIVRGETVDENLVANDRFLNDGDKASLIRSIRSQNESSIQLSTDLAALNGNSLVLDPYDSKDKTRADNLVAETMKQRGAEAAVRVAEQVIDQTGIVPATVINRLRKGLSSDNVQEFVSAAQGAQRISSRNSAALGRREGGSEVQKTADDFSFMVNTMNLSPEEAARRLIDRRDPTKQFQRKALEPAAKEFIKGVQEEDIGAIFDDSWLPFNDPQVGFSEAQRLGIQAEYVAIAEDQFYATNGDPELAKNRAREEMKRLYGVTSLGTTPTVIKHPPEKYWPPERTKSDPFAYAKEQIIDEILPLISDEDVLRVGGSRSGDMSASGAKERVALAKRQMVESSLQIVSTPETDRMVKAGLLPAYAIFYKDANGVLQTIPGKLFVPDLARVRKAQEDITGWAQEEQADALAEERAVQSDDGGRERALDMMLDNDPLTGRPRRPGERGAQ